MPEKLVIFDLGARGGLNTIIPGWLPSARSFSLFRSYFDAYGFEPDPDELLKLKRMGQYKEVYDWAIAKDTGPMPLYITREPDKSSTLEPNIEVIAKNFGDNSEAYEVDRVISVPCRNLDEIAEEIGVFPDWIKIDTQGSEVDILEGAPKSLKAASVLFLELSSISQYKSQRTTLDALEFLLSKGFDVLSCNYKPSAPYENDFILIRRLSESSPETTFRSELICMTLLGMDQQVDAILSRNRLTSFAQSLRGRRRLASVYGIKSRANRVKYKAIRAITPYIPPNLLKSIKEHLGR